MDDDDVKRAQAVKPALEVIRLEGPQLVHLAAPARFCEAIEQLAARA
ncbi:MAG: hypothetical protein IT380_06945 [Myxococcales bacterium]|nr:hypothetical protein [Myxococcales bacterium]